MTQDERLTIIFRSLEGLSPGEWEKIKIAVGYYFDKKTSELKRQLQLTGPDKMLEIYKQLF